MAKEDDVVLYNDVVPEFFHRYPSKVRERGHSLGNIYAYTEWPDWPALYALLLALETPQEMFMVVRSGDGIYSAWVHDMAAFYHHKAVVQQNGHHLLGFYAVERQEALREVVRGDRPS